jgi:hypothetical protein
MPDEPLTNLAAVAIDLGARRVPGWSAAEEERARSASPVPEATVALARRLIDAGCDPLGDRYLAALSPGERRPRGATFTPPEIVHAMLDWAKDRLRPARVVDPGTGSGRFLVAAGRSFEEAELVGIEIDPLCATLARGHLAAAGLAERSRVIIGDYRDLTLKGASGPTLFIGNPPYVRHHLIETSWKDWYARGGASLGLAASRLAGLHAHFLLATALAARPGDAGVFVTSAEWLDVNYGSLVRKLLLDVLGLTGVRALDAVGEPFPGTATTAVITEFEVGNRSRFVSISSGVSSSDIRLPEKTHDVARDRLETADRWTPIIHSTPERQKDFIELGEICRVHRGQVTGHNRVWITGPTPTDLPQDVLFSCITHARELFALEDALEDASSLRRVIDIPSDLNCFEAQDRRRIERFLTFARSHGADRGYIAEHRKAWWSVGLRPPAPILATYMARRPPRFVRNLAGARHINIAHGLYPREPLPDNVLSNLARFLSSNVRLAEGRTYAGGLTKFEPREMERLLVPHPSVLGDSERMGAISR